MDLLIAALSVIREIRDSGARTSRQESPSPTEAEPASALAIAPIGPAIQVARAASAQQRHTSPQRPARPKPPPRNGDRDRPDPAPDRPDLPHALIDRDAVDVVRRLRKAGHIAYLVGGCVRDLSLGLIPKDFDVATSARPEEIRAVFRNCRIIGRRFRLAHVFFRNNKIIETATFRANAAPVDPEEETAAAPADLMIRHDNVFGTEQEDALRRDFTINGLFYDPQSGRIIDHVGGLEDLKLRRVRMIGNPDIRLREDPVRILRAVRIAAKTDLAIDPELLASMERHKGEIAKCAKPRLFEETMRLFRGGSGEKGLRLLHSTGVLESVLPRLAAYLDQARVDGDREREEAPFRHFAALDTLARRGGVTDVVVIAALLHAPIEAELELIDPSKRMTAVVDLTIDHAAEMGATRKMTERLRQVLMTQRHFEKQSGKRSRRRVPPEALMRRAYFAEALDVFELVALATKSEESLVEVGLWRDRPAEPIDDDGPEEADEPTPHAGATPTSSPRRRRRRRGGRGGDTAAATPTV